MKLRLLWHIVRRQFITQRLVIIPFILAVSVLFMIEYTLVSIGLNSYIKQKNDFLVPFIIIANFFMALLTFIFIFYANHFMMSQRRKEFSIFYDIGHDQEKYAFNCSDGNYLTIYDNFSR